MEWKLGSIMLLLSCSLQQSLWGILASVPQTTADKCKQKISSEGAPTKRVQMIRRIPARCSGWDEAWSWLSNKDCRTKYVLDYVELPSAVQKIDPDDCEEEVATSAGQGHFGLGDEKYLAIAFGSATVALLILIVIIVISVCMRGNNRCSVCSSSPAYTTANASEPEEADARGQNRNIYVDDELKPAEPMYEEIHDQKTARKRLEFKDDVIPSKYENVTSDTQEFVNQDGKKLLPANGSNRKPVTPSAPYEEDLQQCSQKSVPNEYSVLNDSLVKKCNGDIHDKIHKSKNIPDSNTADSLDEVDSLKVPKEIVLSSEIQTFFGDEITKIDTLETGLPKAVGDIATEGAIANISDVPSDSKEHSLENTKETSVLETDNGDSSKTVEESTVLQESRDSSELIANPLSHSYRNFNNTLSEDGSFEVLTKSASFTDHCSNAAVLLIPNEESESVGEKGVNPGKLET